jgi:hypothetical protein
MTKEFVTYKQALALKELGFDEPCFGYYVIQNYYSEKIGDFKTVNLTQGYVGYGSYSALNSRTHRMLAPLYQQAFRWFREKHNHVGFIQLVEPEYGGEYGYVIYYNPNHLSVHHWNKGFKTYEEAESACLEKLIEIVKEKTQ